MPWVAAAIIALIVIFIVSRLRGGDGGFAMASAGLTVFLVGGAALAGVPASPSQQTATAMRGRLDLMRADDGRRCVGSTTVAVCG